MEQTTFTSKDKKKCFAKLEKAGTRFGPSWTKDKNGNFVAAVKEGTGDVTPVYTRINPDGPFTEANCEVVSGATFCGRVQPKYPNEMIDKMSASFFSPGYKAGASGSSSGTYNDCTIGQLGVIEQSNIRVRPNYEKPKSYPV
ncbi:hypothetical protein Bca101_083641 [Brassica carinata]